MCKITADDIDPSKPVELIALSVKERTARCRLLGSDRTVTLRAGGIWDVAPGAIVTVKPQKQWRYAGHPYLSGEIQSTRIDAEALDLMPLGLADMGMWDPEADAVKILMDLCQADLRCMHGYGLCLWRLGCFEEAERIFDQMLWLNPSDNLGVRFLIDEVKAN